MSTKSKNSSSGNSSSSSPKKKSRSPKLANAETRDASEQRENGNYKRDGSATDVADVDVNMSVPASVQSLITQVDRNAPPARPSAATAAAFAPRSTALEISTELRAVNAKPRQRSFFERFFPCCASPKDSTGVVAHSNGNSSSGNGSSGGAATAVVGTANVLAAAPMSQTAVAETYPNRRINIPSPKKVPAKTTSPQHRGKKLLALDLDETLVHSSFQPVDKASFVISVTIEGIVHNVYVIKRPGCDEFIKRLAEHYELIIYTASLSKYADPLLDILDIHKVISQRLFRENCVFYDGHYVKDLSLLDREITQTIIVDNSPMSYIFHPENAIDCSSFFDDFSDIELWQIADFLISISDAPDVRSKCRHWREWCKNNPSTIPAQTHRPML